MELDTFIKETLVQIQKGVKEANIAIANLEGTAVRTNGEMQYVMDSNRSSEKDKGISFDIAVTVSAKKNGDVGGKISVAGISLGGGKNTTTTEQNISRIKFKIEPFNSIF